MSEQRSKSPWVFDAREVGYRPGLAHRVHRVAHTNDAFGIDGVMVVPKDAPVDLDVLLESVVEGVLATGTAHASVEGECSRCLDPITGEQVDVEFTELFAYPDSATEQTTDEDEIARLVDDLVDLEPVVRDVAVLALPTVPLCRPDCAGLCPECGAKWADLGPDHRHETIDPRWAALTERFSTDRDD
jgi:uncharacterized protein